MLTSSMNEWRTLTDSLVANDSTSSYSFTPNSNDMRCLALLAAT
jgi:hypothetical protein